MSIKLIPSFKDGDWNALRQFLRSLTAKSVDGTTNTVLKHLAGNQSDSSAISNTSLPTTFDVKKTVSFGIYGAGKILKVIAKGYYSTTGSPTLSLTLNLNDNHYGFILARTGSVAGTNVSQRAWRIEGEVNFRAVSSGYIVNAMIGGIGYKSLDNSDLTSEIRVTNNTGNATLDFTNPFTIDVTATWGTADSANTITMTDLILMLSNY